MPLTLPQEAELILNRLMDQQAIDPATAPEPISTGTINTVWHAGLTGGEPVVVRVGPPSDVVERGPSWMRSGALACEAIVLDRVRQDLDALPVPVAAGFREPERPWLVQRVVPGRSFAEVMPAMRPEERAGIWGELGECLRRLHRIEAPWFGTPDGYRVFPDWAEMVRSDAEGLLDDARRYGLDPAPFERLREMVERHAELLREVKSPAIVHSDLGPRHVFVRRPSDGAWRISGLIDWEYSRYVDPLSESIVVELLARPEGDADRVAFLDGYGLDERALANPTLWRRQEIYRAVAEGWSLTDAARIADVRR